MKREEAEQVARTVGWLSRQPAAFQARLLAGAELHSYAAGETVFSMGDVADDLWCLVSGELSVLIAPETAMPHLFHIAQPGWWLGEGALIRESPRRASMVARTETWTLRVGLARIRAMACDDPEVWRRIAEITAGHLDHALSMVTGLIHRNSSARVALTLRHLANLEGAPISGPVVLHTSMEELGEMTRLARKAIAQILTELEQEGLITRRYREIGIVDVARLSTYVDRLMAEDR